MGWLLSNRITLKQYFQFVNCLLDNGNILWFEWMLSFKNERHWLHSERLHCNFLDISITHVWSGKPQDEWVIQNSRLDLFTFLIGVAYFNKTPQTGKLFTKKNSFFFLVPGSEIPSSRSIADLVSGVCSLSGFREQVLTLPSHSGICKKDRSQAN